MNDRPITKVEERRLYNYLFATNCVVLVFLIAWGLSGCETLENGCHVECTDCKGLEFRCIRENSPLSTLPGAD